MHIRSFFWLMWSISLIFVSGVVAAAGAFAHRGQIEAREHRPVLDRAPPADGVGTAQPRVFWRGQLADIIQDHAIRIDALAPEPGMGLSHSAFQRQSGLRKSAGRQGHRG